MNTQIKVRDIKTIGDISIAAEILIKLLGGSRTVKLKIPLDMIYDGNTGTIDFAEVLPNCSAAMRPMPIDDVQDHIGE